MTDITITLTVQEIQILNNIISNSTPTVPLGTVNQFVGKLNTQIQQQLSKEEEDNQKECETPVRKMKGIKSKQ